MRTTRHIELKDGKTFVRTIEQAQKLKLPSGFENIFTDFDFKAKYYKRIVRVDLNPEKEPYEIILSKNGIPEQLAVKPGFGESEIICV